MAKTLPNAPTRAPMNVVAGPQMREYEEIAERLARDRREHVLDWGCGYGQISQLLRERGVRVTPLEYRTDIDEDGWYEYPWYPGLNVYITSDAVKLPFGDASFDTVLSCGVLEHVVDPDASLEEIRRVLRPKGRFYAYKLPNRLSYIEQLARFAGLHHHGCGPHDRVYLKRSAEQLLERHGLRVREFRRANMLPLNRSGIAFPRASAAIWTANRLLSRAPGLNLFATNLELVAVADR